MSKYDRKDPIYARFFFDLHKKNISIDSTAITSCSREGYAIYNIRFSDGTILKLEHGNGNVFELNIGEDSNVVEKPKKKQSTDRKPGIAKKTKRASAKAHSKAEV